MMNEVHANPQQLARARTRMAVAQLQREGLIVLSIPAKYRRGCRVFLAAVHGNAAERAASKAARQAWLDEGCPEFGEADLFLFTDEVQAH